MKVVFEFGRGGLVEANVSPAAQKTAAAIVAALPMKRTVLQARWSGKEIFVPVNLAEKPPRERQNIRASLGDVIYFREWPEVYEHTGFEAIGLFYGPEIVREWRGDAPVNVWAHIDPRYFDLMEQIGDRVWRQGGEDITIRLGDG